MEGTEAGRVELVIRRGPQIGFEAHVAVFRADEATPFKEFRFYLPTKADCHALGQHIARQHGFASYRTEDKTQV